jgi:glyoxylase-like metal-dependent hydrolase (beta-lactamase superfamily II)
MSALRAAIVPVTPFQQNCTILFDETTRAAAVIDPGGDVPVILDALRRLDVRVARIALTHGHLDHAGGAAELREALPGTVPIEGPDPRDRFLLEGLATQGQAMGMACRDVLPDRWLTQGDTVDLAGAEFEVLHCPGHTPGHVVFVNRAARLALVGDVLFRGSVGRTDFPYGDPAALLAAIRDRLMPLGDDVAFICGHGPGSTIGAERQDNPYVHQALA